MASRHITHLNEAQSAAVPSGDDDQDHRDMQEAIEQSLRARDSYQTANFTNQNTEEFDLPVHTCQNRVTIEDRINDMTMQAAIELPIVHDPQGDTWIYIDPPQKQPEQDEHEYERYVKRYETPMLMQKETLTKYSPGLAKLFGPTQQYRFLRRRKLANKLPSNVKYVIDLTPPSEGEDAVFLTTELCCSEGVRLWYQSNQIWNVSKRLVKGEEEYSSASPKATSDNPTKRNILNGLITGPGGSEGTDSEATPPTILPLEYSPIRHRSSIERLLSALQGTDPILDSATKVWTTFAVAKYFEITHSPLEDYIIRWLRAYPNSFFLEILPEVSHQIADGLQNHDLARDSFAILVGEEALDSLRHAREPWVHKRTTFGRKKEGLPEHIHTRIEYASKSFLERINRDFADLVVNGMQWIDELPEVRGLSAYTLPELQDTVHKLNNLLKDYVRGLIYKLLCADYVTVPSPDLHHDGGHDLLPRVDRAAVWATMPLGERILSRTYWEALRSFGKFMGVSNLDIPHVDSRIDQLSYIEKRELNRGTYREIMNSELRALVRNGQTLLDQAHSSSLALQNAQQESIASSLSGSLQTLPDRTINKTQRDNQPQDSVFAPTTDHDLYSAHRKSNIEPLPATSYAIAARTSNSAQDVFATNNNQTRSEAAQPIDVSKPLKRTQNFPDALSSPDKQFDFNVRTKWPFGAARDDPMAQVQKSVKSLNFSSFLSDTQPATDDTFEESAGYGPRNEGSPIRTDPWRGYSDQLSRADEALQRMASRADQKPENANTGQEKPSADRKSWFAGYWDRVEQDLLPKTPFLTSTKATPKRRVAPPESNIWAGYNGLNEHGRVQQQFEDLRPKSMHFATNFFDLNRFFSQAQDYINTFAIKKLRSPDHLEIGIVNTLVCLENTEWKYLPLYAGGNDDGSMGVFNDDLPTAEHGFTTAGPEIHDGLTPANSVKTSSEFEIVSAGDSASTFNASTATNRGFSDTIRRAHVHVADDSADDSTGDSFTMVTPSIDSDDEEASARKQVEAQERFEEAEEAAAKEVHRMVKGKGEIVEEDESYADLFNGEEEEDGNDTDRAEINDEDDDENKEDEEDMVVV